MKKIKNGCNDGILLQEFINLAIDAGEKCLSKTFVDLCKKNSSLESISFKIISLNDIDRSSGTLKDVAKKHMKRPIDKFYKTIGENKKASENWDRFIGILEVSLHKDGTVKVNINTH